MIGNTNPGFIALFGSGEAAPNGGAVYDYLARTLPKSPTITLLETPAGFQPNSTAVAAKVGEFIATRLQNIKPTLTVVPARQRQTAYSPDDPAIIAPLASSDMIFLGPGSPTYAARQLANSQALALLTARHRHGVPVVTASAATLALSSSVLPVYEIYKVGSDLHWQPGLDFLAPYGLSLVFIPHWNNNEGGAELDTSRCYMGQQRFEQLLQLLPSDQVIVGIDEHTGLILDLAQGQGMVLGRGTVSILRHGETTVIATGQQFDLGQLGPLHLPDPQTGIAREIWEQAAPQTAATPSIPDQVLRLVNERQQARTQRDWQRADWLRQQIDALGWMVRDTPQGPVIEPQL